jgi:hypothetical protein
MAQRWIGHESLRFKAKAGRPSSLEELTALVDWSLAERILAGLYATGA